ncbi:MAG: hypothetical protein IMW89_11865 [Ktedonobacteraceae bacterium]|nr:hypothetical protein [Ktedonobacteraceae bacterium]
MCNGYDEPGCLCFYATADELFDESLQQELVTLYRASKRGHPPIPPAQLALAVILQAYTGVSDKECV